MESDSEISSKCLHNLLLSKKMIHRNNESPLISTSEIINAQEFLYSILFLLLVAGYLVRTHLLFVSRASSELQTECEKRQTPMFIPFITVFLNKFLDNKPNGFLLDEINIDDSEDIDDSDNLDTGDDIDRDLDMELELLTRMNGLTVDMMPEIDRFYITLQFELAKAMSPCIIWILNFMIWM
ncbi:hypothetical protein HAX54_033073 [Datura stramonium]|uniref:Ycf2 N-terminal domain-containing protein n=1 Tax=Datura stramonium TaxID=4076 RepID=A0ABS8VEN0_DATST|nr:hypothetical protein [Datura stramonium]